MPLLEVAFNLPLHNTYTYESHEDVSLGCRVQTYLGRRKLTGWVVGHPKGLPEGVDVSEIKSIERIIDTQALFDEKLMALAKWMSSLTMCALGEALACMLPGGRQEREHVIDVEEGERLFQVKTLTESQEHVLSIIRKNLSGWFYLYGGTGSGKTEVFLRTAEEVLSRGQSVIYLVPEIALSYHLVEGLSNRFPNNIAILHSGLTKSRRLSEWRKIQTGTARFILGARSAVFAPVENLGLIIIDEEHEGSYKSSSTPRYNARQLAMRRCRESQAALIMGSATPSVEAWKLIESGGLERLKLTGKPAGGALPRVKVVDMREQKGMLSKTVLSAMSRVMNEKRQVLLFLNRRGFSYHYSCHDCGEELLCNHCSVPLTYHKNRNTMLCHYCGYKASLPSSCTKCGSLQMKVAGFGTEKIEEEINLLFPEKRIVRLDTDSAGRKGVLSSTLKDFCSGDIDILLGTQMVAKGLNAPKMKLAVVLSADTTLNLPDFRAAERTFAQIVQVSGRVGRFLPDGEVIIQTYRPNIFPVKLAAENKISEFYAYEIAQRHMLGFPPFSRLFRLVIRGKNNSRVRTYANALAAMLSHGGSDWELMGPAECPIGLISGEFRWHIMLRSKEFDRTHAALVRAVASVKKGSGLRLEIDIDPVSLL